MFDEPLDGVAYGMLLQENWAAESLRERLEAAEAEAIQTAADLRVELEHEKAEAQRLQARLNESEEKAMRQEYRATWAAKSGAAALQQDLEARPSTHLCPPTRLCPTCLCPPA